MSMMPSRGRRKKRVRPSTRVHRPYARRPNERELLEGQVPPPEGEARWDVGGGGDPLVWLFQRLRRRNLGQPCPQDPGRSVSHAEPRGGIAIWERPVWTRSTRPGPPPTSSSGSSAWATSLQSRRRRLIHRRHKAPHRQGAGFYFRSRNRRAERRGQGKNRHGRIGARANACGGRNRQECAPAQKPNKFFSARSAPRSASSAFSEEDIPALTVPDSRPTVTIHAEAPN
jgi:hypothetical protein